MSANSNNYATVPLPPSYADVVILDADSDDARLSVTTAQRAGLDSLVVRNLDELYDILEQGPRTVVMDLELPGVDGIEIIRTLAQQVSPPDIIIISALDQRIVNAASRLASAKGITVRATLPKPWRHSALYDALTLDINPRARPRGQATYVPTACDLRRGIANDELFVVFQPKIDVASLKLVGVEALVRWLHPEHGLLPPISFIDVAERHRLIDPLTDVVVEKSFHAAARWRDDGLGLRVALNVSGASLDNLKLPDRMLRKAHKYGLEPNDITVEITEGWVEQNEIDALDILTRLRMKGFQLAIDDFGTGYSTMLRLKQVPFSELKLDRSLIRDAVSDADARTIVESSIDLGQKLGLHLVAEGVENQDDWDLISALGCDEGQGHFIARPMSFNEIPDWLRLWRSSLGV